MRNKTTVALTLWSMLALAGCATTDDVLFVTKTSLGIDVDSKPASVSIAYDRTEGYIAPRYDNGEIPPVVASIKSDASIFNPKIRQVYATGDAAVIAVSECPKVTLAALDPKDTTDTTDGSDNNGCPKVTPPTTPYTQKKLKGEKKLMFFGTTTTTGLKVGFTTYVPDSFVFGFKRKEYSFIPLGKERIYEAKFEPIATASVTGTVTDVSATKNKCEAICASWKEEKVKESAGTGVSECSCVFKEEYDLYPSVLASIDTAANAGSADETGVPSGDTSLSHSQYFATGRAARELAANPAVSKAFKDQAVISLRADVIRQQNQSNIDKIVMKVIKDTKIDKGEFDRLVDDGKMSPPRKDSLKGEVTADTTEENLRTILNGPEYTDFLEEMAK